MKKLTKDEFATRSREIHDDKYDYSLVEYINRNTKVKIIEKETGLIFEQEPRRHLEGMSPIKLNTRNFIIKAKNTHGDKYDYSLVEYKNIKSKVKIIDKEYGFVFEQTPKSHLDGRVYGKLTNEIFIKKSEEIHGGKYDYSLVEVIGNTKKVNISCNSHGTFEQSPSNHMNLKQGCPKCAGVGLSLNEFVDRFKKEHNDKYDYSLVDEINFNKKIQIICDDHGIFKQTPSKHLYQGCPECKCFSKGENKITEILSEIGVNYVKNKSFDDCKNINSLPFDFYLPDFNTIIEYDGIQHFKPVKYFGGEKQFKLRQKLDGIKDKYCLDNNIYLVRIPYTRYQDIDSIIKEEIIDALSV